MISLINYLHNNQTPILEFLNSGNPERAVKYIKSKFPEFYHVEYGTNSDFMKDFMKDNEINSSDSIFAFMNISEPKFKEYIEMNKNKERSFWVDNKYYSELKEKLNHIKWYISCWDTVKGENGPSGIIYFIISPLASLKKTTAKVAYHVTTKELYEKIIKKKGLRTKGVYQKGETAEEVMNRCNDIDADKKKYHQTQNHVSYSPRVFVTTSKSKKVLLDIMQLQTQCVKGGGLAKYEPVVLKIDISKHNLDLYSDQHNSEDVKAYFTLTNIPSEMISIEEKLTAILKNTYEEIKTLNENGFKYIDKLKEKSKTFAKFMDKNFDSAMLSFYDIFSFGKEGIAILDTLVKLICDCDCNIEEYIKKKNKLNNALFSIIHFNPNNLIKFLNRDKETTIECIYHGLSRIIKCFNNNEYNDNFIIDKNLDYNKICNELGFKFINKFDYNKLPYN